MVANWEVELAYRKRGLTRIAGLDEVGRGSWAGPIVAAVYVFFVIPEEVALSDSKQLTLRKRLELSTVLLPKGDWAIGAASEREIDSQGIQLAQYLAYRRAIAQLRPPPEIILLDGKPWRDCPVEHEAIVGGDRLVASIAAASILAKVYRDDYMRTVTHRAFPQYGFDRHVGYGTKIHQLALREHGVCPAHRQSYRPVRGVMI